MNLHASEPADAWPETDCRRQAIATCNGSSEFGEGLTLRTLVQKEGLSQRLREPVADSLRMWLLLCLN